MNSLLLTDVYAQSLNTDKLTFQESNEDSFNSLDAINIMFVINIVQALVGDFKLWLKHSL